ncbi:MAG: DEAD/DEAH box helicase [Phycisphaerales bacterium]
MHFSELGLSSPILRALTQEGYTIPTPIQQQAIPHIMAGRDLLGVAQTGTGKTAAFALPILHRLGAAPADKTRRGARKARALVLSPTRELAGQIAESFAAYGRESGLSHAVIYGGVSQFHQERALARGLDIIVATPGRLLDLMEQRLVDLSEVQVLVLDEADRMLDMGFIQPIRRIAATTPKARQTLLFSATMPGAVAQLAQSLLRDPVRISVSPTSAAAPKIEQAIYMVARAAKQDLLEHLLSAGGSTITRALVFTRTKHGAERVGKRLERSGVAAATIHGNKNQNQRQRALDRFKSGHARVLVATDVAARGLDVDGITHVVNFDLPMEPEAYVHRIGRTGRAGAAGIALSFCDGEERANLRDIERLLGKKIEVKPTPAVEGRPVTREERAERPHHAQPRPERKPHGKRPAARAPRTEGHGGGQGGHAGHGGHAPRRQWPGKASAHGGWRKPSRRASR